ncbi:uncharacterized protein LOC132603618 [Lycium barbarum]|uniref:uncharacterized protein LOC132603618 n=1 Tax=Lycium barbarum TaxID=112863 RepID=UPI00293EDDCE|nr:uncharacterized protein LOC132603618 [Lycium barbarum]
MPLLNNLKVCVAVRCGRRKSFQTPFSIRLPLQKKQTTGKEPSVSDFYFRTHRKEKDKSWVNEKAKAAFNKFEKKKEELLATQSASVDGDTNSGSQPSPLSDMDIWALSVMERKKQELQVLAPWVDL